MTEGGEQEIFAFDPPDRPEGDDAEAFTLVSADEDNWIDKKWQNHVYLQRRNAYLFIYSLLKAFSDQGYIEGRALS